MNERLKPARTLDDAEHLRSVRNACRHFMTRTTHEISFEEQRQWWKSFDRATITPFLFLTESEGDGDENGKPIGYGIVRLEANKKWLTGGLLPAHRGQGHGEQLFRALIAEAGLPCWLEVRASNLPARCLYAKLGFLEVGIEANGILTMRMD